MRLNKTDELFAAHSYPATTNELIAAYGDNEIELQNGSETLGEILSRAGEETFTDPESAQAALMNAVSHKAIGRRFYSDRDQFTPGEYGPGQVSF